MLFKSMGLKKDINHNSPKCSTLIHEHRYLFIHVLECIFILLILYCVLCECGVIGESWNITSCGFYERLESWFQQTKYTYNTINTSVQTTSESLNIDGEIVIETTASGNHTLDVMNQIIMILLPLMVTLIALSFALLPKKIYGVKYADLRRLGINQAYSFLSMIIISIVLFVCCIIFYYLDFVLCAILIDFIALVYIVLFLCLEIPLLSQSSRRINHIIKNSLDDENLYQDDGKKNNENKKIIDNFIYNEINDRGIYCVYLDSSKRKNRYSQKYPNRLLNIYIRKLEYEFPSVSSEERRKLVSDFCTNYVNYLKLLDSIGINYSNVSYQYAENETRLTWEFMQDYTNFNNEYNKKDIHKLLIFINHHDVLNYSSIMLSTNLMWLYKPVDLYKIGLTNGLLVLSLCSENISYLNAFLDVYLGELSFDLDQRPDFYYFLFFTIYLFHFVKNNTESKKIKNIQDKMWQSSSYRATMENSLYLGEQNGMAFYFVTLLKHLLDFYRTLPSDDSLNDLYINWKYRPREFICSDKFVPFTTDDICNWWITFLLVSDIKDADRLEQTLKDFLNSEERKCLVEAYQKYWVNTQGNLKQMQQFSAYFNALNVNTNVDNNKKNRVKEILDSLSKEQIKFETKANASNRGQTSAKQNRNLAKNSNLIKDYIDNHAKQNEFYSSEKPSDTENTKFEILFSREGSNIDGFYTPHFAFMLLFDETGYYNVHDRYLFGHMDNYFVKDKSLNYYEEISDYTEEIDVKISRFNPDKKFAPYSKWMLDLKGGVDFSVYRKILNVENTKTNLIQDTYLKNGAIKFYIKCVDVSNITIPRAATIRSMLQNGQIRYNKTPDGKKYIYHTQALEGAFSEDELVDLLTGNIRRVTVTMEYGVTYDESKMLVYRIK